MDEFQALEREQARVKHLPQCVCCGKISDGAKRLRGGPWLCGTDYDLWLGSPEAWYVEVGNRSFGAMFAEFIYRVQAERRNGCSIATSFAA